MRRAGDGPAAGGPGAGSRQPAEEPLRAPVPLGLSPAAPAPGKSYREPRGQPWHGSPCSTGAGRPVRGPAEPGRGLRTGCGGFSLALAGGPSTASRASHFPGSGSEAQPRTCGNRAQPRALRSPGGSGGSTRHHPLPGTAPRVSAPRVVLWPGRGSERPRTRPAPLHLPGGTSLFVAFRFGAATFPGAAPRAAEGPPLATRGTDMRGPQYAPLNPLRQEAARPGLSAASPWSPHAAAACGFRHRARETRRCRHLRQAPGPLPRALRPSCNGGSPPLVPPARTPRSLRARRAAQHPAAGRVLCPAVRGAAPSHRPPAAGRAPREKVAGPGRGPRAARGVEPSRGLVPRSGTPPAPCGPPRASSWRPPRLAPPLAARVAHLPRGLCRRPRGPWGPC